MRPSGSELSQLADLMTAGKLKVIVDKAYPLLEIADALAYVENGRAKGKLS